MTADYLAQEDINTPLFVDLFDELPFWSAPFGLNMLEQLPAQAGMTIVDVGSGTGFLALELAQRLGPETSVFAVDPWSAAMERLRRKVARLSIENVHLKEMGAEDLDLPDASADLLVSNLGVNNFVDKERVFHTLHRIAKPDAKLCISTNTTGHFQEFYDVFEQTLLEANLPVAPLHAHVNARGDKNTLTTQLSSVGFHVSKFNVQHLTMRFADGSAFMRHNLIKIGFLADWATLIPPAEVEHVFTLTEQSMNKVAREHGSWTVTIPVTYLEADKQQLPD